MDDRMIAGVIGGIARRFGWSSTLLRIVFVIVSIASVAFPGILVYLILWVLMPTQEALGGPGASVHQGPPPSV